MPASIDKRAHTAGTFELRVDGKPQTSYLKSIDGGYVTGALVSESFGSTNERLKHISVRDINPISFEFSLAAAKDVIDWIAASWAMDPQHHNGQITYANFDARERLVQEFWRAMILETTFPTLDGGSKDAGYLKCKIQPEEVKTDGTNMAFAESEGRTLSPSPMNKMHQAWLPSAFRLRIDGIDEMDHTQKIESFTIKQGVKKLYVGAQRFPEIVPTSIEFPELKGFISNHKAPRLMKWHHDYVISGMGPKEQRTGTIEFLATNKRDVLLEIKLHEVGITEFKPEEVTANAEKIARVGFTLHVGKMTLTNKQEGFNNS